ncbi:MAG TPA: response regulator [Thermoanaerobaculia bacterium]|jgi:CheY-like chemotaxis protein
MEKKILVADDSLTIQKVVELMFSDSEYRLTCVSNGRQALEKVHEDPPDLILADVVMPEKNGYEVCEEIKKNPATAKIPVVLLAGTFEPFDRERAERLKCDAIVSKPFDSHQLFRKVESLLAERAGGGRTTAPPAEAPRDTAIGGLRATPFPSSAPPDPFSAGFVEEDFTGSIRNLRGMGRDEPLENLYGPEDVESALEAFREVEPTARATDWRAAAQPSEPAPMWITKEPQKEPSEDEGRTQRIDVSELRASETPAATPTEEKAAPYADSTQPQPQPPPAAPGSPHELSDAEIERLAEKVARKLIEKISDRVVREVAWEVVPEAAELAVRERIRELESGVE